MVYNLVDGNDVHDAVLLFFFFAVFRCTVHSVHLMYISSVVVAVTVTVIINNIIVNFFILSAIKA